MRLSELVLLAALTLVFAGGAGCTFDPINLENRECDCAAGWVCDEPRNICVRRSAFSDSGVDAPGQDVLGEDIVLTDAGAGDGSVDATMEAPTDVFIETDAGPDVPELTLCERHPSALFCDDFERPGLPGWTTYGETGGTTRVSTQFFSGAASVQTITTVLGGVSALTLSAPTPITSGELYVRVRFRPSGSLAYSFLELAQSESPYHVFALSVVEGQLEAYVSEADSSESTVNTVNVGAWNCASAQVSVRESGGTVRFSLNGGAVVTISGIDTSPPGGYTQLSAGVTYTPPAVPGVEGHVDDLVISRTPLPCD